MKESTSESPFKPTKTEFISLPSSKHGSKIFAALLERISNNTYQNNPEANQREYFSQLCHRRDMVTPTRGYDWARGLIPAVLQYSQSEEVLKYPRLEDINDQAGYPIKCLYSLTYNGKIINNVTFGYFSMAWGHGRLSLDETIGDIEDLLEKMMNAPFGAQASSNTTKKEVEEQGEVLDQFYADAAKLVWLIGNTTPMQRGSGSVAELTLKAIFEYHQLKTPILKPEFPQLDVLDITFPLDDYMKLFPYFCEPSSLPEHLRKPSFSSLSSSEQIVQFYNEINGVALIRIEARLSNVAIHNEEKITSSTTPNLSEVKQQNHPNHHLVPTTFTAQNPSEETTPFTARNPSKMS